MKKIITIILLLFIVTKNGFCLIPIIDYKRIASMVAKWVGVDKFWEKYSKDFVGGDGYSGWMKVDGLLDGNLDWSYLGLNWKETEKLFNDELKNGLNSLLDQGFMKIEEIGIIKDVFNNLDTLETDYQIKKDHIGNGEVQKHNKKYNLHMQELMKYNNEIADSFKKYLEVLKDTKEIDEKISKKVEKYAKDIEELTSKTQEVEENKLFSLITLIDFDTMMVKEEFITMLRTRMENEALLETLQIKTEQVKRKHRQDDAEAIRNVYQTEK